jgi:A/G-specific adenine glycosylase
VRRDLPWINHPDPWAILVSEVMLQQTATSRVVDPWRRFLERFATPVALADAPLSDALAAWAGLGYHRRARDLHAAAGLIVSRFAGEVPSSLEDLRSLPGVGAYTASAVASFAFHAPVAVVDTNVGRVLARAWANRALGRAEAARESARLMGRAASAPFNQAMLDVGAGHCRSRALCEGCPLARVCRWRREGGGDPAPTSAGVSRRQAPFEGSRRQVRGALLREARERGPRTLAELRRDLAPLTAARLDDALASLTRDGLVERDGNVVRLAGSMATGAR